MAQLATSDTPRAHEILAAFRLRPEPSILVTVAMAYEGLDAPEVAVVDALIHMRSCLWLEQMVARATRVDPHAEPYGTQQAVVLHPNDPLFAHCMCSTAIPAMPGQPANAASGNPRRSSGSRSLEQARHPNIAARLTLSI